jgi:hypothetical protein
MNAKELRDVLMSFEQAEKDYLWSCDQVDLYDKETQDILHSLELDPLAKNERNRLATRLQRIRRQRREHKNIFEVNEPLVELLQSEKGRYMCNLLKDALGKMRKVEQYHQNRTYVKRISEKQAI